jgi:hypothetical protein
MKCNEKPTIFKKGEMIDKEGGESEEDSNCGDVAGQKKSPAPEEARHLYDPADSIIWDIERESYVEESECCQGTVVLKFPCDVMARGGDEGKRQNAVAEAPIIGIDVHPGHRDGVDTFFFKASDDSLHPSHSASQMAQEQLKSQEIGNHEQITFSRYFVTENVVTTESVGHKQHDLYEDWYKGRRSVTQCVSKPQQQENRSMVHRSQPRTEAHLASPTLSQMISLGLIDEHPRSYDAFSLADIRSVFEDTTMELDDYVSFHDPDAPQECDSWSRCDGKLLSFESGRHPMEHYLPDPDSSFVSGDFSDHDFDFKDSPMFQVEHSYCLPGERRRENVDMHVADEGEHDGLFVDYGSVDGSYVTDTGNDTFLRKAPSDSPILSTPRSTDGSAGDDICLGFPTRLDQFSQGRSLLYGLDHGDAKVSDAEGEVAKMLKQNHWLPHRF